MNRILEAGLSTGGLVSIGREASIADCLWLRPE